MSVAYQKVISRTITTFLLTLISTSTVHAAPLWQGPYVGAYLGAGASDMHLSTNVGTTTSTSYFTTGADVGAVNNGGTFTNNPYTAIAGIRAGHDWVWEQMVYGIFLDYGALPLSSSKHVSKTYPDNPNVYSVYTSMSTDWLFTLNGRLGYQTILRWPALFYVTGGMALSRIKVKNNFSDNSDLAGTGGANATKNQIGWNLGAGMELITYGRASVDIEYLYVYIPSVKTNSSITNRNGGFGVPPQSLTNPFATKGKLHANLLKIGLNYRFDE